MKDYISELLISDGAVAMTRPNETWDLNYHSGYFREQG